MQPGRDYLVRPARPDDGPFLRAMLYEAVYTPPGRPRPAPSIVDSPALAKYVAGWGSAGDAGVVAVTAAAQRPIGAAWLRRLTRADPGYGYVDDATPELTVAVAPAYRGRGIGTRLLAELLATAAQRYAAVSLSVDPGNPALALYRRLGFQVAGASGTSLTMRLDLAPLRPSPASGGPSPAG
jgi:ribosomal protein S18 acetylase RimI-like enzyme